MRKEKEVEVSEPVETIDLEAIQDTAEAAKSLIPQMNVDVPAAPKQDEEDKLISDEKLLGVYNEVLENIRKDREEIDSLLSRFTDMVLNDGDATTSSKEAVVNLVKIKTDTADKFSKIADLMTRARGVSTYRPYLNAKQQNTINIGEVKKNLTPEEKRTLIEAENKKMNKKDVI